VGLGASASQIALVSIVGSFIRLDRYSVGQFMLSRPLVAGTIIGFCLGEAREGMFIGALLELLWIHALPVGDALPGDESLVTIIITSVSCLAFTENAAADPELIIVTLLLFLPVASLGRRLDIIIRSWNDRHIQLARSAAEQGNLPPLGLLVVRTLIRDFVLVALLLIIVISLGVAAVPFLYGITPDYVRDGFRILYFLLPAFGVASLLTIVRSKGAIPIFCAAFLLATVVVEVLVR